MALHLTGPVENYAKLADELILTHKYKVLVTGTQKDAELVNTLCKLMMAKPLILPNNFSIKQLAAVLKRCPVFVSGSTGPMHLAAAVDTSTVSLFPPIFVCSPKRWSPWGNKQKILMPEDLSCKICTYDKCKNYNCMQKITVEEVLNNILELLKQ